VRYDDRNGLKLKKRDVIDIHETVNGRSEFYIESIKPLDIRYNFDRTRVYEYRMEDLLTPCRYSGESSFTIIERSGKAEVTKVTEDCQATEEHSL
jgi:hypothetical protein